MKKRVQLQIFGDVTGVGFRYWTKKNADLLGLTGFVTNVTKGQVEAVFEGEEEKIREMIMKCKKGPDISWVERIDAKWEVTAGEYINFEIRL